MKKFWRLILCSMVLIDALFFPIRRRRRCGADKVLIVTPLRLGDFCMWLPSAQVLIDQFRAQGKSVTLLLKTELQPLAKQYLQFDETITHPYPAYLYAPGIYRKWSNQLRRQKFSVAIATSVERAFFYDDIALIAAAATQCRLAGAVKLRERFWGKLPFWSDRFLFRGETIPLPQYQTTPELENHRQITASILQKEVHPQPLVLPFPASEEYWVLAPFSQDMQRTWGLKRYQELLKSVAQFYHGPIILVGGKSDIQDGESLKSILPEQLKNRCGQTSLLELSTLLSSAKLIFGNDSGVANLALILGRPVYAVTGQANRRFMRLPENWQQYGFIAPKRIEAPPCPQAGCNYFCSHIHHDGGYECVSGIPVAEFSAELKLCSTNTRKRFIP